MPFTPTAQRLVIGPALAFLSSDPTDASKYVFLGPTLGETDINYGTEVSKGGNDLVGTTLLAGGTYVVGHKPVITMSLAEEDYAVQKAMMGAGGVLFTAGGNKALGLSSGVQKFAEPWLVLIQQNEAGLGVAGAHSTIWVPAVGPASQEALKRRPPPATGNSAHYRRVSFEAMLRTKVKDGGTDLPQGTQILWQGAPATVGLGAAGLVFPPNLADYAPGIVT